MTLRAVSVAAGGGGGSSDSPTTILSEWGTCGGDGLLNGTNTESGAVWTVTGPGFANTWREQGGYAISEENAYVWLDAGAPIRKLTCVFEGVDCTMAIGLDNDLADMVHLNLVKGENPFCMYWKTGVGPTQFPTYENYIATIPTTPGPMEFALEMTEGGFVYVYAAGVLCAVFWDAHFPSLKGTWGFSQLHGEPGDKLYNLYTYVGP